METLKKAAYGITFSTTIAIPLLIVFAGCCYETRRPAEVYHSLQKMNDSDRFRSALYNVDMVRYEKELLSIAKTEIYKADYDKQHVAMCVLFAIVEPDQEDPPKEFLVSDLEERFDELYTAYKQDNEVGIMAEKFLYELRH